MNRIVKLSKILQSCFWIWFALMPLVHILYWMTDGLAFLKPFYDCKLMPSFGDTVKPISEMSLSTKMMGMVGSLIPVSINMMAIYAVIRLFRIFSMGEYFTEKTVYWIRKSAVFLLVNQLIFPVYTALMSFVLTIQNPPGQRMIAIALGDEQLTLAVVALTILLISWIMDEGRKMNEDLQGTV